MTSFSLAEVAADTDSLEEVPLEELVGLLAELEQLRATMWARLTRPPELPEDTPADRARTSYSTRRPLRIYSTWPPVTSTTTPTIGPSRAESRLRSSHLANRASTAARVAPVTPDSRRRLQAAVSRRRTPCYCKERM